MIAIRKSFSDVGVRLGRIARANVDRIKAVVTVLVVVGILGTIPVSSVHGQQPSSAFDRAVVLPSMSPSLGVGNPVFLTQDGGTAEWYYATGLQTITANGVSARRHVEVWAAPDGRYRVKSTALDASGAQEEVAYDASGNQLVRIVAGVGAEPEYFVVRNSKHFAITASSQGTHTQHVGTPYERLFVKESTLTAGSNTVQFSSGVASHHRGDPSVLSIVVPDGAIIGTGQALEEAGTASLQRSSTSASRKQTVVDLYSMPCMEIYNFRNTANDYFRATSRRISDLSRDLACKWVHVATWAFGYLNGYCITDFQGQGVFSSFSYWNGTIDNSVWQESHGSNVAACSSHSAFDRYWTPHVTNLHFPAAIPG